MPDKTDELIEKLVQSQIKFAIVKLFRENPYIMDNRPGLALWVGKPESLLTPELDELVEMGILHRWGTEPGAIYAYTRDQEVRAKVDERWPELSRRAQEAKWQRERTREGGGSLPGGEEA